MMQNDYSFFFAKKKLRVPPTIGVRVDVITGSSESYLMLPIHGLNILRAKHVQLRCSTTVLGASLATPSSSFFLNNLPVVIDVTDVGCAISCLPSDASS